MSNLVLNPKWNSAINQVENGELISGGADGNANLATKQLAENVWFLKDKVENDLLLKADKSDAYTKTETDANFTKKSTTLDGYNITDAYTKTQIDSKIGDLTTLKTTDKTSLVKSINEVFDNTKGVVDLYKQNLETGSIGWDDSFVNNIDNKPLRGVNIEQVDKIADLDNLTKLDKRTVIVKSYHAPIYALANPFKGGGGTFIYDASKANVNDGGTCINGWVRQITQPEILVTWFGAKGDGTTDDADAIQKAVNACNALNKPLRIPKGEGLGLYRITKPISITQAMSISGDGYNYCGLRCDGCNGFVIAKGITHVSIINMTILQSTRYSVTTNDFAAIKINGESNSNNFWNAFSNLFVDGFRYVVYGSYFWSTLFNNVISVYCGSGIHALGKSVNNFVNNCQLGGSSKAGTTGILLNGDDTVSEGWGYYK